ncbi:hypothetical protein LL965_12955 [Xanthomonas cassavae CFBP 4642]|uniref:X-Tfes XVIPCD domain-containing protein n=1 Tax=Xanthomonas cassavae CFBP 4642 TaxID=1219375 RepID=A0ABS8HFJ4_9XANT|nr:XVIPCD domain-containing protein [Xanthomonas cassavae]MCC4620956.1 hypothetical protein [Xanthomonas cassavae CFBP 4642]
MTFVLGHEIQHGFNDVAKDRATQAFMQSIAAQARVQGPVHDYTDELRAYIQAGRDDEAKAEIAGWNALLSREQQSAPNANLRHMLFTTKNDRVLDFVEPDRNAATPRAHARPGLTFNQDGSLSQTPANIAAMGQHYFDRPSALHAQPNQRPVHLGEHKPTPTADYTNFYGTWALEQIIAVEDQAKVRYQGAKPQIAIDMAALGLKEDLIEMEGLDLGANKASRPYLDTGQTPAALGHFHHTQDGTRGHDHQYVPVAPAAPPPATHSVSGQAVLRHQDPLVERFYAALQAGDEQGARTASMAYATPERWQQTLAAAEERVLARQQQLPGRDNPLFDQALTQLERLGPQAGGYRDRVQMEQVAGAVAYQAGLHQLPRIDALTPSQHGGALLATSGNPNLPAFIDRVSIDTTQAATQPLEQSLQQLVAETRRQQDQAMFQAQQQMQTQQQGFSY